MLRYIRLSVFWLCVCLFNVSRAPYALLATCVRVCRAIGAWLCVCVVVRWHFLFSTHSSQPSSRQWAKNRRRRDLSYRRLSFQLFTEGRKKVAVLSRVSICDWRRIELGKMWICGKAEVRVVGCASENLVSSDNHRNDDRTKKKKSRIIDSSSIVCAVGWPIIIVSAVHT